MKKSNLSVCNKAVDMVDFVLAYLDGAAYTMKTEPDFPRNLLDPDLIGTAATILQDAHTKLQDALMHETLDQNREKMSRDEQRRQTTIEEGKALADPEISAIMGGLMNDVPLTRGVLAARQKDPARLRAFLGVDPEPAKGNGGEIAS